MYHCLIVELYDFLAALICQADPQRNTAQISHLICLLHMAEQAKL